MAYFTVLFLLGPRESKELARNLDVTSETHVQAVSLTWKVSKDRQVLHIICPKPDGDLDTSASYACRDIFFILAPL